MSVRRLRRLAPLAALTAVLMLLSACAQTVPSVDIARYQGLWYEISSFPTGFNQGLVGTTATYTPQSDGSVRVYNHSFVGDFTGPVSDIVGSATAEDPTNAKLLVRFGSVPITQVFPGLYWIVDLGPNYEYAAVGDPFGTTLFILSRTPTLSPEVYNGILGRVAAQGFDIGRLKITPQLADGSTKPDPNIAAGITPPAPSTQQLRTTWPTPLPATPASITEVPTQKLAGSLFGG